MTEPVKFLSIELTQIYLACQLCELKILWRWQPEDNQTYPHHPGKQFQPEVVRGIHASTYHPDFGRWLMLLVVWLGIEEQVHGMKFWTGSMTHACRWWYGVSRLQVVWIRKGARTWHQMFRD